MVHYIYLRRMNDGRIYVGETSDLTRRDHEHQTGKGGKTTSDCGAGKIIYTETHPDKKSALKREHQLKGWIQAKKLALAEQNMVGLKNLSRSTATKQKSKRTFESKR